MKTVLPPKGSAGCRNTISVSPAGKSWKSTTFAVFFVRRQHWTMTWMGRLTLLAAAAALTVILSRELCTFLAVTSPAGGQFLVVESWMPTYAYREAAALFRKNGYDKAIVAGVLDWDENGELGEHFGGEKLIRFGVPSDQVVTMSSNEVQWDRTFHAAMAVKQWLQEQGMRAKSIDVVTIGPHARRSRLLFEKALGSEVKVGVIAVQDRRFNPTFWWRSSVGVRAVVGEMIAYVYIRIFFFSTPMTSTARIFRR